ncbi:MAG: peptidase [Magnetococcales bacterium]|nr:peptidase [Magnetococcales bacterium]
MNAPHLIAIFKSGRHADQNGTTLIITDADLERTVAAYDPARWKAPLVIGHPRHDAPAWGWVAALSLENGTLMATLTDLDPQVVELVQAGRYRNVSTSFYTPDGAGNPFPGVFYPRHVGLLGAQPPAVKGMPQVQFSETDDPAHHAVGEGLALPTPQPPMESGMHTTPAEQDWQQRLEQLTRLQQELTTREARFAEQDQQLAAREETLRQAEAEDRQQRAEAFVDALIAEGRILPRFRDGLIAFLLFLSESGVVEFAEGHNKRAFLEGFLKELPPQVNYAEQTPERSPGTKALRFQVPQGYAVDPDGLQEHARILAYANAHHTDYLTAALAVSA